MRIQSKQNIDATNKSSTKKLSETKTTKVENTNLEATSTTSDVAPTSNVHTAKNPINIPRGLLEFKLRPSENLNEDTPILVYCAAGLRAALAGQTLKELGFNDVKNLGGFDDWVKAGGKIDT